MCTLYGETIFFIFGTPVTVWVLSAWMVEQCFKSSWLSSARLMPGPLPGLTNFSVQRPEPPDIWKVGMCYITS